MTKKLWVIGGTSGIGQSIANMAEINRDVYATGLEVDVTQDASLRRFYKSNGPFDEIVYSAGINKLRWIADLPVLDMMKTFDVNVFGFMRLLNCLVNNQQGGRILAVTSDAAVRPMRTSITYCSSKAALDMAIKVAAREMAPDWVVNGIAPGMTHGTEMQKYIDRTVPEIRGWDERQAFEYEQSQIPMGRRAHTSEIARVALSILEAPDYMTGSIVAVNGGR